MGYWGDLKDDDEGMAPAAAAPEPAPAPPNAIETFNKFMVGSQAGGAWLVILNPPRGQLTPDDALLLAAYLVSMAEPEASHPFAEVLGAVLES